MSEPDLYATYGHKNKARAEESSMKEIFTWGHEGPNAGDFIKNGTNNIRHKIKKADKEYTSEVHDNYRQPIYSPDKKMHIFNYEDGEL